MCSGIEAASVAWEPLGWRAAWLAEIEPFPSAVLAHHWPEVANLGDMNQLPGKILRREIEAPDVLVGGTPCQAFSVAGLRAGLGDERGQLTLRYVETLNAIDLVRRERGEPEAVAVWENVPGVLLDKENAFGCFLAELAGEGAPLEPGPRPTPGRTGPLWGWDQDTGRHYPEWPERGEVVGPLRKIAWCVLDARDFGLPQRRHRVFVVASGRDEFDPAAVFPEPAITGRDCAETGEQGAAAGDGVDDTDHLAAVEWWDGGDISQTLDAVLHKKQALPEKQRFPAVKVPAWVPCDCCDEYQCNIHGGHASECACAPVDDWEAAGLCPYSPCVYRFITPLEAERLQGFPDFHTLIPWRNRAAEDCPDGPRYKAIGNSKAVPVVRWLGQRIQQVLEVPA